MRSPFCPGLFALLVVACGGPAAPAEPPAAPAPSSAASETASVAPAASTPEPAASAAAAPVPSTAAAPATSTTRPAPSASADTTHAARQAALAEAADFSMVACVRTPGSGPPDGGADPCAAALPPRGEATLGGLSQTPGKPLPGTSGKSSATMREGAVSVSGRLPPELIQRIVRQSVPQIRSCYESALKKKRKLAGRVATKFVIDRDGSVKAGSVSDNGSDLPDPQALACILGTFKRLSFPAPEGGIVTVVYPFLFAAD